MEKISECEEMVLVVVYRSRTIPRVKDILVDVNWLYGREWKAQTVCPDSSAKDICGRRRKGVIFIIIRSLPWRSTGRAN